jgi:hypothetical protein
VVSARIQPYMLMCLVCGGRRLGDSMLWVQTVSHAKNRPDMTAELPEGIKAFMPPPMLAPSRVAVIARDFLCFEKLHEYHS